MRIKIAALFLAAQALSFVFWSTTSEQSPWHAANVSAAGEISHAATAKAKVNHSNNHMIDKSPEALILASQGDLHLSFSQRGDMTETDEAISSIQQNQILTALAQLPTEHAKQVKNITLDYNPEARRGLGGNHLIILRAVEMTFSEFIGVLVHEVGHNVDYGYLVGTDDAPKTNFKDGGMDIHVNDPSYLFYRLSWEDTETMKAGARPLDFVSGYAMADPFEDFAETYIYYIMHNRDFKVLAASNEILRAKYEFMRDNVFDGVEFDSGTGEEADITKRPWDTTVLPYDVDSFMG